MISFHSDDTESLLFVFLDDVGGPHLSLVRIFPDGAQCSPLTQEIPGLVEFDLERAQAGTVVFR